MILGGARRSAGRGVDAKGLDGGARMAGSQPGVVEGRVCGGEGESEGSRLIGIVGLSKCEMEERDDKKEESCWKEMHD